MIDLSPGHLATVKSILAEHAPGCEVRAFGSRATWTASDRSDLDLAVVGEGPLDRGISAYLKEAFEQSNLPMRVDVLDWYRASEEFREVIEAEMVVLVGGRSDVAKWCTLGDLAEITMGQSPPGSTVNREQADTPLLNGPTEFGPHHPEPVQYTNDSRRLAHPGDLLFCVRGSTTGRMNWADRQYAIGRGVAAIRHRQDPGLQPFVRAVIEFALPELLARATGSTFPNVSAHQLAQISCPSFAPPEQRAISHILGTLDDKIELNRRMNATLEAMSRALFKSWFIDFDPVRVKMGRKRGPSQSLTDFPIEYHDLFPRNLVNSVLGPIPEGWKIRRLGDLTEMNPRERIKKTSLAPYLNMASLPVAGPCPDAPVLREFKSGSRFRNGDTLLARITPCLENGKTAFVQLLPENTVAWGSTEFIVMRAISPVPAEYPYLLARNPRFRAHAIQSMTGTLGRQRARRDALSTYLMPCPPLDIWIAFGSLVRPLFAMIESNRRESGVQADLRDVLLPKLISGELRVKDADQIVEEVI